MAVAKMDVFELAADSLLRNMAQDISMENLEDLCHALEHIEESMDAPKLKNLGQQSPQQIASILEEHLYDMGIICRQTRWAEFEFSFIQTVNYLRNTSIEANDCGVLGQEATSEWENKANLKSFTHFPKFPQEIQDHIWERAIEQAAKPRIVEFWTEFKPWEVTSMRCALSDTALQHMKPKAQQSELYNLRLVRKGVNKIVMKRYTTISGRDLYMFPSSFTSYDKILLDPKIDVVFFNGTHSLPKAPDFEPRALSEAYKLETIAVCQRKCLVNDLILDVFHPLLKGLKKILFIVGDKHMDLQYYKTPVEFTIIKYTPKKDDSWDEYIKRSQEDHLLDECDIMMKQWNDSMKSLVQRGPTHLTDVEIVFVRWTRINPPKLLSSVINDIWSKKRFSEDISSED